MKIIIFIYCIFLLCSIYINKDFIVHIHYKLHTAYQTGSFHMHLYASLMFIIEYVYL